MHPLQLIQTGGVMEEPAVTATKSGRLAGRYLDVSMEVRCVRK